MSLRNMVSLFACSKWLLVLHLCWIGMKMEGLFRVPGPAAVMEELRAAFEEGTKCGVNL